MLNLKQQFQKRMGFSLLELILGICLTSILTLSLYSIMNFSLNITKLGESKDELILNGRYAIEYIKEEIKGADKIISTKKINSFNTKYPKNFGFIIMQDTKDIKDKPTNDEEYLYRYRFISYYLNGNVIQRIACSLPTPNYPTISYLKGHNIICESVISISESNVDFEKGLINLSITVGNESGEVYDFKSTLYMNCLLDYWFGENKHMNRQGSVTILALIIMTVILINAAYLIYITKIESIMTVNSKDKIQSYYLAESKINKVFYDDKYYLNYIYPVIKEKLQNMSINSFKIYIDDVDMDKEDKENYITCSFTNYTSTDLKRYIVLETNSEYKGIETSMKAYGPIVNDLYELEDSFLDSNTYPEITELLINIKDNISKEEFPSGTNIKVVKTFHNDKIMITNDKKIKLYRNNIEVKEEQIKERNFFIIKNELNTPIDFQIGENGNSNEIKFEGLIYVEGNLYINSNFKFRGIMIVDGNTYINPDIVKNSEIKGIVLSNGFINDKSFILYDRSYVYRYGVYLPGFIQPRLEVYKKLWFHKVNYR